MEDASVPLDKVLDCVASCVYVAHLQDILKNSKKLIEVFSSSLSPGLNWPGIPSFIYMLNIIINSKPFLEL